MGNTFFFEWEVRLMEWLQSAGTDFTAGLASYISEFGEELILIVLIGFLYWSYDKKIGKFVGINIAVGIVANPLVKNIFVRRRPYFDHASIQCLKPVDANANLYDIAAQGYSFPSGHSQNTAIAYPSIALQIKRKWIRIAAFVIPLLVGVSRFFLGVHYPTDVLGGWILGLLLVCVLSFLQTHVKHQGYLYLALSLIGAIGFYYCTSNDYFTGYGLMTGFFAGFIFEEKAVKFESTRNVLESILRVIGGIGVFLLLKTLLKLPFPETLLKGDSVAAHFVRAFRYFVTGFIATGVYPLSFRALRKIFRKG